MCQPVLTSRAHRGQHACSASVHDDSQYNVEDLEKSMPCFYKSLCQQGGRGIDEVSCQQGGRELLGWSQSRTSDQHGPVLGACPETRVIACPNQLVRTEGLFESRR